MTIAELIAKLQKHPPETRVVVDLHSEYTEVTDVDEVFLVEKGGYVSHPYGALDEAKARLYLRIR